MAANVKSIQQQSKAKAGSQQVAGLWFGALPGGLGRGTSRTSIPLVPFLPFCAAFTLYFASLTNTQLPSHTHSLTHTHTLRADHRTPPPRQGMQGIEELPEKQRERERERERETEGRGRLRESLQPPTHESVSQPHSPKSHYQPRERDREKERERERETQRECV